MDLERGSMPTPDDLNTLLASNCEIYTFSGIDAEAQIRDKLDIDWDNVPLNNDRLSEDVEGQEDITRRLTLVYIAGFFTDGSNFVYYIKGGSNMSRFLLGTFSGTPYDKPCFATPLVVFDSKEIFGSSGLDTFSLEKVPKTESKGIRWKYLYESGVKAWEKLSFNGKKYETIRKRNDEIDERVLLMSSSESPEVEVVASVEPETNETLSASKKAEDHGDDIEDDGDQDERVEDSDVAMDTPSDDDQNDGKDCKGVDNAERAEETDEAMDTPGDEDDEEMFF